MVAADTGGGPRVQVLDAAQFQAGADPTRGKVLADFLGIDRRQLPRRHPGGGRRRERRQDAGPGRRGRPGGRPAGGGLRRPVDDPGGDAVPGGGATSSSSSRASATGRASAVGDVDGDGRADLVAGAGPGGAPRVAVFSGSGIVASQGIGSPRVVDFYVSGDTHSRAGTRVTVKDLDRDGLADVVATVNSRAYVYTAAGIRAFHQTPLPGMTGPGTLGRRDPLRRRRRRRVHRVAAARRGSLRRCRRSHFGCPTPPASLCLRKPATGFSLRVTVGRGG